MSESPQSPATTSLWTRNPLSAIWQPSITTEPPTLGETRRNDAVLLAFVVLILLLGWLLRFTVREEVRTVTLREGLPTIIHPEGWVTQTSDAQADSSQWFVATNPASPSTLDSELRVEALPVREGESLETLRVMLSLHRNQELERYRELEARRVLVGNEPGYLVTYAYIADPTRESGAPGLPVVAEAQDLLFGSGNLWLVITTTADAIDWQSESLPFTALHEHLQVRAAALQEEVTQ